MCKKKEWLNKENAIKVVSILKEKASQKFEEKKSTFYAGQCSGFDLAITTLKKMDGYAINNGTSDGVHTFGELYKQRAILLAVLVRAYPSISWKSKLDHAGNAKTNRFLVGFDTPDGQATFHVDLDKFWDTFDCVELERAKDFDGHNAVESINRILSLCKEKEKYD